VRVGRGEGSARPLSAGQRASAGAGLRRRFQFTGSERMTYVPRCRSFAQASPLTLEGTWRDEYQAKHHVERGDGSYRLRPSTRPQFGTGGVTHTETGDWKARWKIARADAAAVKRPRRAQPPSESEDV